MPTGGDTAGEGTPVEGFPPDGVGEKPPKAAETEPVSEGPKAGEKASTADYEAQIKELKGIQSGQDKSIGRLTAQLANATQENERLQRQLAELDQQATGESDELQELKQTVESATAANVQLREQLEAARQENQRTRIVASEFPILAPMLKAGALPHAETDAEFRQKLSDMAGAFSAQADAVFRARVDGAVPVPASPSRENAPPNREDLWGRMLAAQRAGNDEEYEQLRELWYANEE